MHTTEDKPTIHDPREEPTQFFITDRLQLGEIIEQLTVFTGESRFENHVVFGGRGIREKNSTRSKKKRADQKAPELCLLISKPPEKDLQRTKLSLYNNRF